MLVTSAHAQPEQAQYDLSYMQGHWVRDDNAMHIIAIAHAYVIPT